MAGGGETQSAQRTVLVTGWAGFSGRTLVPLLRAAAPSLRIVGLDCVTPEDAATKPDEAHEADLCDAGALLEIVARVRPDYVVHLAGAMPPADGAALWTANVGATQNLLLAVHEANPAARVVSIGSAAEYGATLAAAVDEGHACRPTTEYGRTKLAQTFVALGLARQVGLHVCVARPFNLIGPGMPPKTVVGEACAQLAASPAGGTIRLGRLTAHRDFVDIRDAVRAYWAIATGGEAGEIYNVCSGVAHSVESVIQRLVAQAGGGRSVEFDAGRVRAGDVDYSRGSPDKTQRACGFSCEIPLERTLADTLGSFAARKPVAEGGGR